MIYFIIALLGLSLYISFMILKFRHRVKVNNPIVFLHGMTALAAFGSFSLLVATEFKVSMLSILSLALIVPGIAVLYSGFRSLKSQAFMPKKFLIKKGIYSRIRNPIYLGLILIAYGCFFLTLSAYVISYAAILNVAYLFVIRAEEKELSARFGSNYEEYRKKVPSLIPRLKKTL